MTTQDERNKRFDEKFEGLWLDGMHDYEGDISYTKEEAIQKLKSFLNSEIELALAERDKKIVEMILENVDDGTRQDLESYKFIQDIITQTNERK